jgi:type II secretory pathway component GspD/PulD (secretin)
MPMPSVWAEEPSQAAPASITGDYAASSEDEESTPPAVAEGDRLPSEESRTFLPATQQERLRTVVTLSFTNANLKNVLNSLAKTYALNIVAGEEVAGTVTIALREVALEEALRQILKLNGFGFTVREGIIEIAKLKEKRVGELLPLKYLNADTALEFIQSLASEGSVLKVDETANAILVNDYLHNIDEMRALLAGVDQQPQQVLIEAKLMDIRHTDLDNLGFDLSSIAATIPIKHQVGIAGTSPHPPLALSSGSVSLGGPASSSDIPVDQFTFTLARADDTAKATLDTFIRNKRVKVIASPTVVSLNNVESKIVIGEKFPIREQTQTTTGTLETTRFVDVGTTLRVTPRINRDGYIQMHIHPEVSSVSETLDAGPRITTRESDATLIVRHAQSIVMAGLLQEDETKVDGLVPILGHLPFIGLLFQNRSKSNEQKELVVIITPYLVELPADHLSEPPALVEAANRLNADNLFQEGVALEERVTLRARRSPSHVVRYLQALDTYQQVIDRYPTHPYAMEALWRIGRIAMEELHDVDRAEAAYQRLMTQFPSGPYHNRAARKLRDIRRIKARRPHVTVSSMAR